MEIVWYGQSCFRLTQRGLATVVTDPYDSSIGLTLPRLRADIVTVSHDAPGYVGTGEVKSPFKVLTGPGEYEIGGVFVTGIPTFRDNKQGALRGQNTIFLFDFDGLTVCHLGSLGHVPTQSQVEALGTIDVLLVPVGGGGALAAAQASEVISLLEARLVVPMHYKIPGLTVKLDTLGRFLKEMGLEKVESQEMLKLAKADLPEEMQVVVLEPKQ